jgi:hypothetical protein
MARCGSVAYENANGRAAGGLVGALAYRLDRTAASSEAALRYLVLSLAIVAIGLWRMPVKQAARRKFRDRKRPPDRD